MIGSKQPKLGLPINASFEPRILRIDTDFENLRAGARPAITIADCRPGTGEEHF
jgi:hypothetical protein